MSYTYDIKTSKEDVASKNCLFWVHMLSNIVNLFVSTFLVAHIYSFNGNTYAYLFNVGIYNIFNYLIMMISYPLISRLVDKTKRVGVFRFSLILKVVLVVTIIFFGEQLSKLLILAGAINGLADSFYFASFNVIKQEMVSRKSINGFVANVFIISQVIGIVCPVILGYLIDVISYSYVAIIALVVLIVQLCLTLKIKSEKPTNSQFDLRGYLKKLNEHPNTKKKMVLIYVICSLYGVVALTTNLINVCVMLEFGSNFSLGAITSVFAVLSIIALSLTKNHTKPQKRTWLYVLISVIPILSAIAFVIYVSPITVVILNGTISLSAIIYKYLFDIYRNGILKESGLYSEISEHHTMVDILANISRIVCFGILLLVAKLESLIAFKIMFVITICVIGIIIWLIRYFEYNCLDDVLDNNDDNSNNENNQQEKNIETLTENSKTLN